MPPMKLRRLIHFLLFAAISGLFAVPTLAPAAPRSGASSIAGDPGGHTSRGLKYARKKQYDKAVAEFNQAIEAQPNDPENYRQRALSYRASGKLAEAEADYTQAIEIQARPDDYTRRARIALKQNKAAAGLKDLDHAIEINPQDIAARRVRAYAYLQKKEWARSIAEYDVIIQSAKKPDLEALERRGFAYRSLQKYDLAVADFSKMIEFKPKNIEAYRRRASVYRAMKQNEQAKADLRKILKLKPDDAAAKTQLAFLEKPVAQPTPQARPKGRRVKSAKVAP